MMFTLVPPAFKAIIKTTIKVSFFCEIAFFIVLLIMGIVGIFEDIFSSVCFSVVFLCIIPLALIPCLRHYKTSQSSVEFSYDCIRVVDEAGACWREIPYDAISSISVENISGFFYGQDRQRANHKYICVYLNGCTRIPDVAYHELFKHKDFFMSYYQENVFAVLSGRIENILCEPE